MGSNTDSIGGLPSHMLTLGYKASAEQFGPRDLLAFAIHAERAGFESVFVSDHFQPWRNTDGHAPNCLVWLGALAMRTQKVTIGTSVLTPSFRYHPAVVAQAFSTLASLAGAERRIVLGLGTGESLNEVPLGIEWPEQKERFARLKEATELIDKLFTEEFVTFEGQFFRTHNAKIYDKPERAGRDLDRRVRSGRRAPRRPRRGRLHLHVGQGHGALLRDAAAGGRARAPRRPADRSRRSRR